MIEQSIVHLPELVKDIERPVSIYLVHLSSQHRLIHDLPPCGPPAKLVVVNVLVDEEFFL
jgi:hypothetical protein